MDVFAQVLQTITDVFAMIKDFFANLFGMVKPEDDEAAEA